MSPKLESSVQSLVDFIKNYETEVFSASSHNLTTEQSEQIVIHLFTDVFDDLDG